MVEGGGLLNRYRVKSSIEGSNPSPSASSLFPNVHICPLVRCASRRTGHWQLPLIIAWVDYKDARDRRRAKQSERA